MRQVIEQTGIAIVAGETAILGHSQNTHALVRASADVQKDVASQVQKLT